MSATGLRVRMIMILQGNSFRQEQNKIQVDYTAAKPLAIADLL